LNCGCLKSRFQAISEKYEASIAEAFANTCRVVAVTAISWFTEGKNASLPTLARILALRNRLKSFTLTIAENGDKIKVGAKNCTESRIFEKSLFCQGKVAMGKKHIIFLRRNVKFLTSEGPWQSRT
jgi:hypothetical protein